MLMDILTWHEIKNWLEISTGLDRDSLHIYGAVIIQLVVAGIPRFSVAHIMPWFAVLLVVLANEYYDYDFLGPPSKNDGIFLAEAYQDVWNSMLLPTVLFVVARFWPRWLTGNVKNKETAATAGATGEAS